MEISTFCCYVKKRQVGQTAIEKDEEDYSSHLNNKASLLQKVRYDISESTGLFEGYPPLNS